MDSLAEATDAMQLHRALVAGTADPTVQPEREHTRALSHFRRVHLHDRTGAADTALLLVTDPQFAVPAGPLMEAIEAAGVLTAEELDTLATTFVHAGLRVFWTPTQPVDGRQAHIPREVPPALRRWAAARLVRNEPWAWSALMARAHDLGGAAGGAVVRGLLDAGAALDADAATRLRNEAMAWGRGDVRLAALQFLATTHWRSAKDLGLADADDRVRRWATDLHDPSTEMQEQQLFADIAPQRPLRPQATELGQGSLFG